MNTKEKREFQIRMIAYKELARQLSGNELAALIKALEPVNTEIAERAKLAFKTQMHFRLTQTA